MNISRQTYYKYRSTKDKDYEEYLIIKEAFEEGKRLYGYRKLKKYILLKYGWIINHKKLLRIMKKYNLRVRYQKVFRIKYRKIRQERTVEEDLLKRDFTSEYNNEKWCTDITYLIHKSKRAYLSSIIDLKDRKVIAHKISRNNDNKLVIDTLNEALSKNKDVKGTIIHSDQGFQYTSNEYRAICQDNGLLISMSAKGTPLDNAPIESFHANFKRETFYSYNITSLEEYQQKRVKKYRNKKDIKM